MHNFKTYSLLDSIGDTIESVKCIIDMLTDTVDVFGIGEYTIDLFLEVYSGIASSLASNDGTLWTYTAGLYADDILTKEIAENYLPYKYDRYGDKYLDGSREFDRNDGSVLYTPIAPIDDCPECSICESWMSCGSCCPLSGTAD